MTTAAVTTGRLAYAARRASGSGVTRYIAWTIRTGSIALPFDEQMVVDHGGLRHCVCEGDESHQGEIDSLHFDFKVGLNGALLRIIE